MPCLYSSKMNNLFVILQKRVENIFTLENLFLKDKYKESHTKYYFIFNFKAILSNKKKNKILNKKIKKYCLV